MAKVICPDCSVSMDVGYLSEVIGLKALRLAWVEGPRSDGALGDVKDVFREQEKLDAYRCPKCGHVKLYADKSA